MGDMIEQISLHFQLQVCSLASDSVTPWTVACQASLSMEFSSQEYWSGLPFPFPRDLPNPGIEPGCLALPADSFPSEPPQRLQSLRRKPVILSYGTCGSSGSHVDRQLCKVDSSDETLVTLPSLFHNWVVGLGVVLCV